MQVYFSFSSIFCRKCCFSLTFLFFLSLTLLCIHTHTQRHSRVLETLHVSASNDYFAVELAATAIKSQLQPLPLLDNTAHLDIYKPLGNT